MKPSPSHRCLKEGLAHHEAGRAKEAAALYAEARRFDPASYDAHHLGGMAALMLGHQQEALILFTRALALNPRAVASALAKGLTQVALGHLGDAEKSLGEALRMDPKNAEAWDKLALLLRLKQDIKGALFCHAQAVSLAPLAAAFWYNHGITLLNTERYVESLGLFERSLACDPAHTVALSAKALCLFKCHRVEEAVALLDQVLEREPRNYQAMSYRLHSLNYRAVDRARLFEAHLNYGRVVGPAVPGRFFPVHSETRALRVGFLSGELRRHSITFFLKPLLEQARAAGVDVYLYHDHGLEDAVSEDLKRLACVWRKVVGVLDQVLEARILADAPDVLIDLGGHTGANRLALLARRVAPVQITYLGYPNTTGVQAMDYRFVDAVTDLEGLAEAWHTEKLVRFAPTAWCYEPPAEAPEPVSTRRAAERPVTFGSFNHFAKVTDEVLKEWGLLLKELPEARLVLKSLGLEQPSIAAAVGERMEKAGLDVSRVDLLGACPSPEEHLALYHRIDVALDPSPYNGTTTTCEALWMGVPVVTIAGGWHSARVGLSLLTAIGRENWVANSWEEYRAIARRLAQAPSQEDPRGVALRDLVRGSVLLDKTTQAQRFWAAVKACAAAGPKV